MYVDWSVSRTISKKKMRIILQSKSEVETVTESQSVKSSSIKVVILNKYNGAEIISDGKLGKRLFYI